MNRLTPWILICLGALPAACATLPMPAPPSAPQQPTSEAPAVEARSTPPKVLYHVLAGEVAGQHEDYAGAAQHYLKAARLSEDPAIAQRATQIALFSGDQGYARQSVARLLELTPDSAVAHHTAASLALQQGDPAQIHAHLERMIALSPKEPAQAWQRAAQLLARSDQPEQALAVMGQLVQGHPEAYHAEYAYSLLASHFERMDAALAHAGRALALNPEWGKGYSWRGRIKLSGGDYAGAAADFERALALEPEQAEYRYHYAEALRRLGRFDEAQSVLAQLPRDAALLRTRAALAIEAEDWALAEDLYRELLALGGFEQEAWFFLGQLAELQERFAESLDWYERVHADEYRVDARIREAVVLNELWRLDEALALLDPLIAEGGEVAVEAYMAKGQLLADNGRIEQAFVLYEGALEEMPDNTRLRYARAILAAEQDRVELAERDFRAILAQKPDDAMALNALGYTLADQTRRYQEALELIRKALELKPEDAAVIDSMGWVQYRLGNYQAAERHLRRALELQFDPEVAAHLGEVLWVSGQREAARQVWQQALEQAPEDSAIVRETMRRLTQ